MTKYGQLTSKIIVEKYEKNICDFCLKTSSVYPIDLKEREASGKKKEKKTEEQRREQERQGKNHLIIFKKSCEELSAVFSDIHEIMLRGKKIK